MSIDQALYKVLYNMYAWNNASPQHAGVIWRRSVVRLPLHGPRHCRLILVSHSGDQLMTRNRARAGRKLVYDWAPISSSLARLSHLGEPGCYTRRSRGGALYLFTAKPYTENSIMTQVWLPPTHSCAPYIAFQWRIQWGEGWG